jgi:maltose O-acetyltransferase
MKKLLANFFIRLLMHADSGIKGKLYSSLKKECSKNIYEGYREKYEIASDFRFNGENILFYGEGKIYLGSNSYIGNYSTIQSTANQKVSIGNNCSISHNVRIYTSSNIADQNLNTHNPKGKVSGDVFIGNGVWIGANVFVKEGITIGDNAIVGANSVVSKNIEANSIYGGVPAKLIRMKEI